jgi:peptidoglycan/LPS O-acetylase OafA/YrhL
LTPRRAERVQSLECLRGCAALIVVAWHLLIGLAPMKAGIFPIASPHPMIGRLWFAPFNGSGAVTFFFVLSGFVLPWRFFHSGNLGTISTGLLKRWPRLAGPCMIVTTLSWLLFTIGAYHFAAAGALTGSPWLQGFANSGLPPGTHPDAVAAVLQGAFTTFFAGVYSLDSSMWTMRPEIVGSIVVFGMAPILHSLRSGWACLFVTIVVGTLLWGAEPHVPQFLAGTLLARLLAGRSMRIPPWGATLLVLAAFFLFGFYGPRGDYAWLAFTGLTDPQSFWMLWAPAAVLLILATLGCAPANRRLSGRVGVLLGRLSFPLYLVHVPIFCSAGAWVYVALWPITGARVAALATVLTVLPLSLLAALALSRFDIWWVGRLNRAVESLRR